MILYLAITTRRLSKYLQTTSTIAQGIAQEYASLQDTGLNKHLHRINPSDTSNCPNCSDTEETVAHYIGQCPAYSRIRGDTLGTYYDSINNIMDNNNIDLIINNPPSLFTHPHRGDQVPSAGHHVGGWVIFSPKNTVSTWY